MGQAFQYKQLVVEDCPDHIIPDLLDLHQYSPQKFPFFLESSANACDSDPACYDILFIQPEYWLKLNDAFQLSSSVGLSVNSSQPFLQAFDDLWLHEQQPENQKHNTNLLTSALTQTDKHTQKPIDIPFLGGWFVFFSYELAQQIEPSLKLPQQQGTLPVAYTARVKSAVVHNRQNRQYYLVSEPDIDIEHTYRKLMEDIQNCQNFILKRITPQTAFSNLKEEPSAEFIKSAARVKRYIREGDVFQVNLSRLWQAEINCEQTATAHTATASNLYRQLRKANPAPFSAIVNLNMEQNNCSIISSSPERLLKVRNDIIESRPIAGTRPRSQSRVEDRRLQEQLHANPKEQAEHVMLIDLIRNDLGRVCVPGTVKVDEFMINESYAHVHHIVSNISGKKQPGKTPGEVIKAIFPGGTITGCPKVRCMEIIAELEKLPRAAYTGSMGYINLDGSMDLNILIRTMILEEQPVTNPSAVKETTRAHATKIKQMLSFRAGAGLVADSNTERELLETRAKAKGLLKALEPFKQSEHSS